MESQDKLSIFFLVVIALVLTLVFYAGENPSFDDATYARLANQALNGTYNITSSPYGYGSLFIYGLAISKAISSSFIIPQILEYVGLVVICYILARRYFDDRPSFLAALFMEASPFVFAYATRILPDMLLGLLIAIGLCFVAYSSNYKENKTIQYAFLYLGGLSIGLTIFVQFGGGAFILFIIIASLLFKEIRSMRFLGGITVMILLYIASLPNVPEFNVMLHSYSINQASITAANLIVNLHATLYTSILWATSSPAFSQVYPLGGFLFFAIAGIILVAIKKNKELAFYAAIFLMSYLWLFFGPESLTPYSFITVTDRYFIWLVPEMTVLCACMMDWILKKNWSYSLRIILIIFIISNLPMYIYFYQHPITIYGDIPKSLNI